MATGSAVSVTSAPPAPLVHVVREEFQIGASDHPGLSLVNTQLDATNWMAWKVAIEAGLSCKLKEGFIDGSIAPLMKSDPEYKYWKRADNLVVAWYKGFLETKRGKGVAAVAVGMQSSDFAGAAFEFAGNSTFTSRCESVGSKWILDTGASCHLCCDIELLIDPVPVHTSHAIYFPNGTSKVPIYKGKVKLNYFVTLSEVYYVPGLLLNLISISKLTSELGCKAVFNCGTCLLQDQKTNTTLLTANLHNNLYTFHITQYSACFTSLDSVNHSLLWHMKLGHPSWSIMKHIDDLTLQDISHLPCDACLQSKAHRLPFSKSLSHASTLFDLVHIDLWGPYCHPCTTKSKYMLTIVDDFSRGTWVYFLQAKSEVVRCLTTFCTYVQTQYEKSVKVIRSDNGSEFCNQQCSTLFNNLGIVHQTSCVYTPQQNGRVERKHRHLIEIARSLLAQSGVPKLYWNEAILTAVYLVNRLPSSKLDWKSPYELIHGRKPDFGYLHVFGCLCYMKDPSPNLGKLDAKGIKSIFLGYSNTQKGYKILNLETSKICVSRDVVFFDSILPYLSPQSSMEQFKSPNSNNIPMPVIPLDPTPTDPSATQPPSSNAMSPTELAHSPPIQPHTLTVNSTEPAPLNILPDPEPTAPTRPQRQRTFNPKYKDYVCNASEQLPNTYSEACLTEEWRNAMEEELSALTSNNTWELTSLPDNKKAIGCKWVYRVKYEPDGTIAKYKARLVAKGYDQKFGVDFHDSFAPVAKQVTVRVLIALAASLHWGLHQLDVNNAFLHGDVEEEIYMDCPLGLAAGSEQVCRLKKAIYGLKQAPRQWNKTLTDFLLSIGLHQIPYDHCLFVKFTDAGTTILAVYVDDILITGNDVVSIAAIKNELHTKFTIKDLGVASYYLELELERSSQGYFVSQTKFIHDLLSDLDIPPNGKAHTPLWPKLVLQKEGELFAHPKLYRQIVGKLLYLCFSRPDLSFAVQQLSQFMHCPTNMHWKALVHVLQYLQNTLQFGLMFPSNSPLVLTGYCDADWGSCPDTRKSLSGSCIFLGGALVSWKTKKQDHVSKSTTEAEYRSLASATSELLWISYILGELHLQVPTPVPLYCDNEAAIKLVCNPVHHERTKHIDITCHFVREHFHHKFLEPLPISSDLQVADLFTKSLPTPAFLRHCSKLNLCGPPRSACGGDVKMDLKMNTVMVAAQDSETSTCTGFG